MDTRQPDECHAGENTAHPRPEGGSDEQDRGDGSFEQREDMAKHTAGALIALALALTGCQTRPEGAEETLEQITAPTPGAPETEEEAGAAPVPQPTGFAVMTGQWAGNWSRKSPSTLTITTSPDAIEYCDRDECWPIEAYVIEGDTLEWTSARGWRFRFAHEGERLKGKLDTGGGTGRITMKRM